VANIAYLGIIIRCADIVRQTDRTLDALARLIVERERLDEALDALALAIFNLPDKDASQGRICDHSLGRSQGRIWDRSQGRRDRKADRADAAGYTRGKQRLR
jgi:hypothetical protein